MQEKFLHDRIKVNGKSGNLGDNVKIIRDKSKIHVNSTVPFSKRYLKYLTKKYLKNQKLRDWLHVVAVSKANYEIRYDLVSSYFLTLRILSQAFCRGFFRSLLAPVRVGSFGETNVIMLLRYYNIQEEAEADAEAGEQ